MKIFGRMASTLLVGACLALYFTLPVFALEVPPVPTDSPVLDRTNTLTSTQIESLSQRIAAERTSSGNQLAVLMIPSLEGEAIEDYSIEVARAWGIGEKGKNNGILLLVVKNDRLMRIEVGYGLEGELTDAQSNRIIRNTMAPYFRDNNYFQGIDEGLQEIIAAIHNENGEQSQAAPVMTGDIGGFFPFLFIIPVWLGSILGRTKSWWAGGVLGAIAGLGISAFVGFVMTGLLATIGLAILGLIFDWMVSRNYRQHVSHGMPPSWWAGGTRMGGFGGGRSGGGFGGFGGGSFGGGGSSGRW